MKLHLIMLQGEEFEKLIAKIMVPVHDTCLITF